MTTTFLKYFAFGNNCATILQRTVRRMSKLSELAALQDGHGGSVTVDCKNNVAIITMDRGENRMNDEYIQQMNSAFDEALRFVLDFAFCIVMNEVEKIAILV